MKKVGSMTAHNVAKELIRQVERKSRATFRVLDVAAGTGRVGVLLHQSGFRNVEALGMKRQALF